MSITFSNAYGVVTTLPVWQPYVSTQSGWLAGGCRQHQEAKAWALLRTYPISVGIALVLGSVLPIRGNKVQHARPGDRFAPVVHAQFTVNGLQMTFDGVDRDDHRLGDFAIGVSCGEQL